MEEKRRRGRPRKNDVSDSDSFDSQSNTNPSMDLDIDKTDFDFYEPENFGSPIVEQYNPLADTPIKRDYSSPKIQEGIVGDIIEPSFHQPSITQSPPPPPSSAGRNSSTASNPQTPPSPISNPNPAVNDLDNADKKMACEQLVDAALDLYETIWMFGGKYAQKSENDIQQLVNDGEIDPNERIPIQDTYISIFEFCESYNKQVEEAVKVDKEFKKKVRPPMIRVFTKHGWGLTDEQFLMIAFGKDAIVRGMSVYGMKKSMDGILNALKEQYKTKNEINNPPTPPPPPPSPKPKPKPTSPPPPIIDPKDISVVGEEDDDDYYEDEPMPTPIIQRNEGVEKLSINFDDNPLRQDSRREPPPAKVEETFIQGGEIKDDLSI